MINSYIDYRGSEGCDRLFERYQFIGPRTYAFHSNLGKLAITNEIYKGPFKQRAHKKRKSESQFRWDSSYDFI